MIARHRQLNEVVLKEEYEIRKFNFTDKSLVVPLDTFIARIQACYRCPKSNNFVCLSCKCQLQERPHNILDLAIRTEALPKIGCKNKRRHTKSRNLQGWRA